MKFNIILKNLRKSNNLTQLQLGKKLNLAESTISLYESGKRFPDQATLLNLSKIFNVSLDFLLGNNTNTIETNTYLSPEAERLMKKIQTTDSITLAEIEQYLNYLESKKDEKKTKASNI